MLRPFRPSGLSEIGRQQQVTASGSNALALWPVAAGSGLNDERRHSSLRALLANAKLAEDPVQDVVGVDHSQDSAQVIQGLADVDRDQLVTH